MEYPKSAEFVIIGGGIIGISTAYHLAKAGKDVIVLDANELVSQASGRNGGMVVQLDARDANIAVMKAKLGFARKGLQELKNYQKELDVDFEFKQVGCLDFIFDPVEMKEMEEFVEVQHESGDDEIEIIDAAKTKELMPIISDKVLGARYRPSDGKLNPLYLCFGIADKAKEMGVRFFEFTRVEEILRDPGKVRGVRLSDGTFIKSDWVVNCTNAWSEALTPEIRIVPIREIVVITEPVPEIKQCTYEAYIGSLMGTEEEQHCWGTSQHTNGNICIGGPGLLSNHFYPSVTYEEAVNTVNMMKAMFPILDQIKILRYWCGSFAFTPDYNPYVGHIEGTKGLFVVAGLNNGFALGPALSKLGSELILDGEASLDITTMNPMRFVGKDIVLPKEYQYAGIQKYIAEHSRQWLA